MSTPEEPFLRLVRLARSVPVPPQEDLPHGLATRVLAQVRAEQENQGLLLWERLSLGAVRVAAVTTALCLLLAYAKEEPPRADAELLVQNFFTSEFAP